MDEMHNSFGRLSTKAPEWKPQSLIQQEKSAVVESDSNVGKDYNPGLGWNTVTTATTEATSLTAGTIEATTEEEQHQISYDTTIPNGPTPASFPDYRSIHSLGISDDLWRYYRDMSLESIRQMDPYDPLHKAIPPPYCNAYCLDAPTLKTQRNNNNNGNHITSRSSFFGYPCLTFQVSSRDDGYLYCLRRFDNVRSVSAKIALTVTDQWTKCIPVQEHPGIVPFYQCFLSQRAVFFVHHFIPRSQSLKDLLISCNGTALPENTIWSCIVQIVSAMRTIHRNLLAVRSLRLPYILATTDVSSSRIRIRLGAVGIVDALEFESRKHITDLQCDDIRDLGRLILSIASGTEITSMTDNTSTFTRCDTFVAQNYSRELHNLAMTLIRSRPRPPSINEVSQAIAQYCFDEQDSAYRSHDRIERGLCAEYESGRAVRLLLKLGYINERPEMGLNRRWSQSGDCYVLSLFRDYVFHQADGAGNPVMDLGHVMTTLNKLDAAVDEKIVLSSRDGKSLMVVTYADIGRCIEIAYQELCSFAVHPSALQY